MNSNVATFKWNMLTVDQPMRGVVRQRIVGEHVMISRVVLDAGCVVPVHHHANEQMACVMRGKICFTIGTESSKRVLGPGEVLHIPANVPHGAQALEDCEILDVFAPPSETTGVDQSVDQT